MAYPRLHPDTIEQVNQRADIVDVISEHVVLRKRGKDFVGLCPFHEEKTPSFSVSPSKQMYYCFGCGVGGNSIKFLMDLGKRAFSEVVLELAQRYQVPVQTLEPEQRQELQRQLTLREQLYEIMSIAAQFYQHTLRHAQGQSAQLYLQQERQLSQETIQQFGLGYAPVGWETLYRYLVIDKQKPAQLVEQAGLILPRKTGDGYYDRFRDRLMIPIHDVQGRVIGFGGRSLGDEQPKYLNSPETELFSKGKILFALDTAKTAISGQDRVVVVEGYFDAIALHAAGITNVVASLGTALSLDQVRQLLRYTESKQVVFNFDADAAGTKASIRAIGEVANLAYRGEVQLRILNLPEGKDADEFLRHSNVEQYRQLLLDAPLWLDWQIQQIMLGKDLKQANQSQQIVVAMVKLLSQITDDNQLTHYIQYCAELLSQGDSRLVPLLADNLLNQVVRQWGIPNQDDSRAAPLLVQRRLKQHHRPKSRPASQRTYPAPPPSTLPVAPERNLLKTAEALLLRIYLHCPEQRQAVIEALQERDLEFSLSHHRFLWQQILALAPLQETQTDLISSLQNCCLESATELEQVFYLFHLDEKTQQDILRAPLIVQAAVTAMERVMCEKRSRHFLELWEKTDSTTEPDQAEFYYQSWSKEQRRLQKLDLERQFSPADLI